jgi:hypothetical protein
MRLAQVLAGLLLVAASAAPIEPNLLAQVPSGPNGSAVVESQAMLPKDVFPDSRSRLPLIKREGLDERGKKAYDDAAASNPASGVPLGVAAIKLHGSGVDVRYRGCGARVRSAI